MPLKDGVVELRQKGASLRMIRELLATVGVAVSTDTIARFLAEVNGEPSPPRPSKRSPRRRLAVAPPTHTRAGNSAVSVRAPERNRHPSAHACVARAIADPRNL